MFFLFWIEVPKIEDSHEEPVVHKPVHKPALHKPALNNPSFSSLSTRLQKMSPAERNRLLERRKQKHDATRPKRRERNDYYGDDDS